MVHDVGWHEIMMRDHVIVSDIVKSSFNLNTESTNKPHSIINNAGKELVNKIDTAWIKDN